MNIIDSAGNGFKVDRSARQTSTPRVKKFSFGDGYEQRLPDGINTLGETFSINFINRPEVEMELLVDFFAAQQATAVFAYSPPSYLEITSNIDFVAGNDSITWNSGPTFAGIYDKGWILASGTSFNDGGYPVDSTSANSSTTIFIYDRALSSEVSVVGTLRQAVGVICENWNVVHPQDGIMSVSATLKRVYEP